MDFVAGKVYRYFPNGDKRKAIDFTVEQDEKGNLFNKNIKDGSVVNLVMEAEAYIEEVKEEEG